MYCGLHFRKDSIEPPSNKPPIQPAFSQLYLHTRKYPMVAIWAQHNADQINKNKKFSYFSYSFVLKIETNNCLYDSGVLAGERRTGGTCPIRGELIRGRQSSMKIYWGVRYVAGNELTYSSNDEKKICVEAIKYRKGVHDLYSISLQSTAVPPGGLGWVSPLHFSREQKFRNFSGGKPPDPHFHRCLSLSSLFMNLSFVHHTTGP